jgi:hypothetical protein
LDADVDEGAEVMSDRYLRLHRIKMRLVIQTAIAFICCVLCGIALLFTQGQLIIPDWMRVIGLIALFILAPLSCRLLVQLAGSQALHIRYVGLRST